MNILVLADGFAKGGMESQIDTYYHYLKKDNNIIYGFANYIKDDYLKDADIHTNFHFSFNSTISEFLEDVNNLIEIINTNKIDVIHVHPFYCIFPAVFAANITNTKLVYTYHGRVSINFCQTDTDSLLFEFFVETFIQKIFCVSSSGVKWFEKYRKNQAVLFPNIIDDNKYQKHLIKNNKKWALVSRLDNDKEKEIIELLNILPNVKIDRIDIFGDGNRKDYLIKYVTEHDLNNKVKFMGYKKNLYDELKDYNGVIGLGRVAIESLIMGYPTLLIGYGKIYGLIDSKKYTLLEKENFVPTDLEVIDYKKLNKELDNLYNKKNEKKYYLRLKAKKTFGTSLLNDYIKYLKSINPLSLTIIDNIYNEIINIEDKNTSFYYNHDIKNIIMMYIGNYTNNPTIKDRIINIRKDMYFEDEILKLHNLTNEEIDKNNQNNEVIKKLSENIDKVDSDIKLLINKIDEMSKQIAENGNKLDLEKDTSLLTLIKRDLSKIKYRIFKK